MGADSISDVQNLQLQCFVDGEERQNASTSDMLFSVADMIEDATKYMTLNEDDIIMTGTPSGVGPVAPGQTAHGIITDNTTKKVILTVEVTAKER